MKLQLLQGLGLATVVTTVLVAQPVFAQVVQVTEVQLNSTDNGIEVVLETPAQEQLQVLPRTEGNTYIADIPNAQLRLRGGNTLFRQENPVAGITSVTVTSAANSIRVTVIGASAVPAVELFDSNEGLIFSFVTTASQANQSPQPETPQQAQPENQTQPEETTPSNATPQQAQPGRETQLDGDETATQEDEPIEIVVTGEQETPYSVPDASTATRTDTPIRDIPQSIQVVPEQVLEDQRVIRLEDALRNVSGVFSGNNFGGTIDSFNIRGFADATTLRDGFRDSFTESGLILRDPANIEQIEVLKGPASVLYGNVEPGGVINFVTKQPLADPFYQANLSIGTYSFYRPSFDLSGSLTPDQKLRYRLNAAYENAGSFRDFVNSERVFVAPVLAWRIGNRTKLSIDTSYLYDRRILDRGIVALGEGIADIPRDRFLGEPGDFRQSEQLNVGYNLEHEFNDNLKIRNAFQYLQNNETVKNTNALELDETTGELLRDYFDNANEFKIYAMQTELTSKFNTGSIEHQLLFGFDLQRNTLEGFFKTPPDAFDSTIEDRFTPSINIFNPVYNVRPRPQRSELIFLRDDKTTVDSLGIFLQDQIALTDNFKILVSGRFDTVTQRNEDNLADSETSQSNQAFSPRVGIVYQPIELISVYASYSRSFAPNTGISADGSLLEPTRGTQYEVGIKTQLNERFTATLAAYQITKTNIATTDPIQEAFSLAIGEQRSRGIELDISGEITPGWNIIASYSNTNAEITESTDFPVGNKIPNVPRNQASLWTTYELQNDGLQGLGFGLGLFYVDARQGDLENSFELPSYLRTDAAIFYRRNNWRAAINLQNLFDVGYFETSEIGRNTVIPGTPFTVIGSFAIEF